MDFLRNLLPSRRNDYQPETPSAPKPTQQIRQTYGVEDHQLTIEAATLDAFYAADNLKEDAQAMFDAVVQTEALKDKDGSEGDLDDRTGHVVLPNVAFEFHPDTKLFSGRSEEVTITGDGRQAIAYQAEKYGKKDLTGTWNREENAFEYKFSQPATLTTSSLQTEKRLLNEETFEIGADGQVSLPGAQSLAEAESVLSKREMAQRAEDLISSAVAWQHQGQKLDGKKGVDLNSTEGSVVAPDVERSSLHLEGENVLSGNLCTVYVEEDTKEDVPYGLFDLQTTEQGEVTVVGSDTLPEWSARLEAQLGVTETLVTFAHPNRDSEEQVVWNKTSGTVTYKKFHQKS